MAASSMDITINAPTEDVWAILADFPINFNVGANDPTLMLDHSRNLGCRSRKTSTNSATSTY